MSYSIEIDQNHLPANYKPVAFRHPKIGEIVLQFKNGEPIATRFHGNFYLDPCVILKETKKD